jgi:hypothetical protein
MDKVIISDSSCFDSSSDEEEEIKNGMDQTVEELCQDLIKLNLTKLVDPSK